MKRLIAVLSMLAATAGPAAAAPLWAGGGAPPGLVLAKLAVEGDGTMVALNQFDFGAQLVVSQAGQRFQRVAPVGLDPESPFLEDVFAVAGGGLRVVAGGELYGSTDHGRHLRRIGDLTPSDLSADGRTLAATIDRARPLHALRVHADGAVQRSIDGGASWVSGAPLPPMLVPPALSVSAAFGADGAVDVLVDGVLWRSPDLADSWQRLPGAPASGVLVPSPVAAAELWVAGTGGVYRSDDAGATWHRRLGVDATVVPSPTDAAVAWAIEDRAIVLTEDGGASWRTIDGIARFETRLTPATAVPAARAELCVASSEVLWCSTDGGPFRADLARFAGTRFGPVADRARPARPGPCARAGRGAGVGDDRWLAHLASQPGAGRRLPGRGRHPRWGIPGRQRRRPRPPSWRCDLAADGGPDWPRVARGRSARWHGLRARRRPPVAGRPRGTAFRRVAGRGLPRDAQVTGVSGHGRTIVALDVDEVYVSTDGGARFRRVQVSSNVFAVTPSPFDARLLLGWGSGLYRSRDAGRHWQRLMRDDLEALEPDPHVRGRWFATIFGAVAVSSDDGRHWRALRRQVPPARPAGVFSTCCVLAVGARDLWASRVFGGSFRFPLAAVATAVGRSLP